MSGAHTQIDATATSPALPVESAPGETDSVKLLEQAVDEKPAQRMQDPAENASEELAKARRTPKENLDIEEPDAEAGKKQSEGQREEKIVQDAVKQSKGTSAH